MICNCSCRVVACMAKGGMSGNDDKVARLTQALRDAGVRITRQRAALLAVLADAEDHPDAVELHRRSEAQVPGISLSTVYRTLSALEQQGVIHRLQFEGGSARFESTEAPHHDHMIDVDSGRVVEFCSERIERLQAEIAAELGYEIVHHRLELYVRKKSRKRAGR